MTNCKQAKGGKEGRRASPKVAWHIGRKRVGGLKNLVIQTGKWKDQEKGTSVMSEWRGAGKPQGTELSCVAERERR